MSRGAVARVKRLQRAAFCWALQQGFNVAALDIPVSQIGARLDVAACKLDPPRMVRGTFLLKAGPVMVFECKADRADFLRDTRSEEQLRERLRQLNQQRESAEEALRRDFPTLREGVTLFPEFDVYRFQEVGGEEYRGWLEEISELSQQLYSRGRFSRMLKWRGANLHYVVAEEGVAHADELPANWGLIELRPNGLLVLVKAIWQDAPDVNLWGMATKIAATATKGLEETLSVELTRAGAVEGRLL